MAVTILQDIKGSLLQLYLEDQRAWLVSFSAGKDSIMLASLVFGVVLSIPAEQRIKAVSVVCTDTRADPAGRDRHLPSDDARKPPRRQC